MESTNSRFLKSIGFDQLYSDPCVYINKTTEIIIAMWVDDLIIFGKDMTSIEDLKAQLNEEYEMKELGELKYFLSIQVHRDREGKSFISISQGTIGQFSNGTAWKAANRRIHLSPVELGSLRRRRRRLERIKRNSKAWSAVLCTQCSLSGQI